MFARYGGACTCCGEAGVDFLTIDHINEDGAAHRRALSKSTGRDLGGVHFYEWLVRERFPRGFQVLCWNCNISKHLNKGVCSHAC